MSKRINISILMLTLVLFSGSLFAQVEFSGDVTAVSNYVWRGVLADGAALQGTVSGAYKALSFGVWYSSVGTSLETDPFVELTLPTGSISSSIGATAYSYDMKEFAPGVTAEYELFATVGAGPLGVSAYFVPSQKSTDGGLNESLYWIEASTGMTALGADWGITYAYGTYSVRAIEDATSLIALSATKSLSDALSISYNYSLGVDDELDDVVWVGVGYSF
ncbi:hypothetical protein JW960_02680 [candidate division KSB1 bacterium]|nr:hypothetical protein [candidate division KSB1 bacterium]